MDTFTMGYRRSMARSKSDVGKLNFTRFVGVRRASMTQLVQSQGTYFASSLANVLRVLWAYTLGITFKSRTIWNDDN